MAWVGRAKWPAFDRRIDLPAMVPSPQPVLTNRWNQPSGWMEARRSASFRSQGLTKRTASGTMARWPADRVARSPGLPVQPGRVPSHTRQR